jgi:septum formation protein
MLLELILASASSARARLLREMGIPFRVVVSGVDETDIPGEVPDAKASRLARAKAEAVAARVRSGIVLGADSLVVLTREGSRPDPQPVILGKPRDATDAEAMLRLQMGRITDVITAVCLLDASSGRRLEGVDRSSVRLNPMLDKEIKEYASSPRVLTSAGGYLIEDEHDPYVTLTSGELGTVLGLPLGLTKRLLKEMGAPPTPNDTAASHYPDRH